MNTAYLKSIAAFLLTIVLLASSTAHAQSEKQFRWKMAEGDAFVVQLVQESKIKSNIEKRVQEITNKMTLHMDWKVLSVDGDKNVIVEQSIKRIELNSVTPTEVGTQTVSVDTDNKDRLKDLAKKLYKQVFKLINTKYTVKMSARGEILDVEIPKESMEAIRQAPSSMQLRKALTEKGLKDMFGQSVITFPAEAINKGSDWSSTAKVTNSLGAFNKTNTYTYAGTSEKDGKSLDEFSIETKLEKTADGKIGSEVIEFKSGGELLFDSDNGYVTESSIQSTMNSQNSSYKDTTINTVTTTSVSMKVTRK